MSDEFDEILAVVRSFVREEVVPLESQIDQADEVPAEVIDVARAMGLFGFTIPEEYGGLGLSVSEEVRLVEELGYTTPALRSYFGTNNGIGGQVLVKAGTPAQRHQWLPRLASGEVIAAFALTEETAGSDPRAMTTRAERVADGWRLNGAKRFITNALVAGVFMTFAKTQVGGREQISVFIVPADSPGVTVGPREEKMGQKGTWVSEVFFDDVLVEEDALVGGQEAGVGSGYRTALASLSHGRVHISAMCVGMMQRLLDETVAYASTRVQGGQAIGRHQLIQAILADMHTDLVAGRALLRSTAEAFDAGTDRNLLPASTKYFCSEAVGRCADRAVQVFGGSGYIRGVPVERMFRDARLFRIYEGTSQIQQLIIGRALVDAEVARASG